MKSKDIDQDFKDNKKFWILTDPNLFLPYLVTLPFVFSGSKTPSVSWLQDNKHEGIRLRHFKVFPCSSPVHLQFYISICLIEVECHFL